MPWCHPPGVQWLMHPGCQLCASRRRGSGDRRSRWGRGEFSTDRDIQMLTEPSVGSVQSSGQHAAYLQHCESAVFNVPAPYVRSVLMFQRRSWAGNSGDGLAGGVWWETQWGEKARLWLCTSTPSSLWVLLHIKAGGRRGGSWEKEGVIVSGRLSVSQIVMETCWDEINGEPPSSCQHAKLVLVLLRLNHMQFHSVFIVIRIQREIQQRYGAFQAWNCWFPCVFTYFEILRLDVSQLSNAFNLHVLFTHVNVAGKCRA